MTRVALVGVGDVSVVHLTAIEAIQDAELVGLVETDHERAEAAAAHGVAVYGDHNQMYADLAPDVVHVTTPHHQHAPVAVDLLDAGANVILEKPLAHSRAGADAIIEAARRATGKVGICFQNRYNATAQELKRVLDQGELGTIQGAWANVVWTRTMPYYQARPWRATWDGSGGGVLINQAIHTLDLVQWLLGGVEDVRGHAAQTKFDGQIEVEDTATAWITHPSGAQTTFFATLNSAVHRPVEIEIWGELGSARLFEGLTVTDFDSGRSSYTPERLVPSTGRAYWGYSHELLIRDFYDRLDDDQPFWISPDEADITLQILAAIYRDTGPERPLTVPQAGENPLHPPTTPTATSSHQE
ncbi:Gfo/Idh/MocA family protein [Aestuariimicrobium ganziense]|uniref:Gfo/Idh/MocA family protein n=1 Tax=Aestuariimicrobium ganziense TaxID=2773677 RepID=UPI001942177E|nr:Gfo/Idh/MocA family oxidoreductase [Aestuariimicrobium ganziense]